MAHVARMLDGGAGIAMTGVPLAQLSAADRAAPPSYVRVRGVDKIYGTSRNAAVVALKDVSFDLYEGEFLSVLGPSGCGKSTLLKTIAGLAPINTGSIEVKGRKVDGPPENMGIVFQRDVLLDWLDILDNVLLPIRYARLRRADWEERALALLRTLGLAGFERGHPWELSGGMRQRVSICRALLRNPDLLLMDEPFGALDALTRDELNLELQRIWVADAKTVLFITHSIVEAVFLSDRVLVMSRNPGRVLEVIAIDLPRPRPLAIRETPEFGRYVARIRRLFEGMGFLRDQR
jgi:NitT/TauT family transport system ATP-binding protein